MPSTHEALRRCLRSKWAPPAAVLLLFALSRLGFYALGVRFDASTLTSFWQFLEVEQLRDDLLRSVYHQHSQPPLFNLYLGAVLKAAPGDATPWFRASYLALGAALHLALYRLLIRLGVSVRVSLVFVALFLLSPACIAYENHLLYTYPVAVVLIGAALFLHRFAERGRARDGVAFFALLATAVWLRSVLHLVWFVGCLALVLFVMRGAQRRVAVAALLPLCLVVGLYAKNLALFGSPATSTWLGMSVARRITQQTSLPQRRELVRQGVLSPLALIEPFSPLHHYPPRYRTVAGPDVPVLRAARRSSGFTNFNHVAYVQISRIYLSDAWTLLRRNPELYLESLPRAWLRFFASPTDYWFARSNVLALGRLDRAYSALLYGVPEAWSPPPGPVDWEPLANPWRGAGYLWIAASLGSVVFAFVAGARAVRRTRADRSRGLVLLFAAFTVVYVACTVNLIELGENNRFRMMVEPLLFALVACAVTSAADLRRRFQAPDSRVG